jgi:hypothetical protein
MTDKEKKEEQLDLATETEERVVPSVEEKSPAETADPPSIEILLEDDGAITPLKEEPVREELSEETGEDLDPKTYHRQKRRAKLKKRLKKLKKQRKDLEGRLKKAKKKKKKKKAKALKKKLGAVKTKRKDLRGSLQQLEEEQEA